MSENQSEQPEAGDVIVKASSLSGRQVENRAGEVIGIVKDMVLDLQHSRVQYVVISIGGALNVGDELIAVPTRVLSVAHNGEHVVFDASNKQIEQAQRILVDAISKPPRALRARDRELRHHAGRLLGDL
jgi:sporulation protein YlmC with PRC-barrel domain